MVKKKQSNDYFTKETEEYIIKFNESNDIDYKNSLFTQHIYYPFYKLAENIIHTFKFYYTDTDAIEDLKCEIVTMLYKDKISKFNPTNGAKAYSYFGTIVKRWLISYNIKNYKKLKQVEDITSVEELIENEKDLDKEIALDLSEYIDTWITECYRNLDKDFSKEMDRQIADAILTVFTNRKSINILKKKALYIYLREITGYDTHQITRVINTLKSIFYHKYINLLENGHIYNEI